MKKLFLILSLLLISLTNAQTKVGTINTEFIMSQMPELESVDQEMKAYSRELDGELRKKFEEYQELSQKFQSEEKDLNDVVKKFRQNEIADLEEEIQQMQEKSQQKLRKKQEDLLRPLYNKIGNALEVIVEKENYTQVFTESSSLVFVHPDYDLTKQVMEMLELPTDMLEDE